MIDYIVGLFPAITWFSIIYFKHWWDGFSIYCLIVSIILGYLFVAGAKGVFYRDKR
jgi:hypothetical protein